MSRKDLAINPLHPHTRYTIGDDPKLGWFLQIADDRFINHPQDMSGEGYMLDYDEVLDIGINVINATKEDIEAFRFKYDRKPLQAKVEAYFHKETNN